MTEGRRLQICALCPAIQVSDIDESPHRLWHVPREKLAEVVRQTIVTKAGIDERMLRATSQARKKHCSKQLLHQFSGLPEKAVDAITM